MQLSIKTACLTFVFSFSRSSTVAVLRPEFQIVEDTVIFPIMNFQARLRAHGGQVPSGVGVSRVVSGQLPPRVQEEDTGQA